MLVIRTSQPEREVKLKKRCGRSFSFCVSHVVTGKACGAKVCVKVVKAGVWEIGR